MVKEEVKQGEEVFTLPNEKVTVKPNLRNPGWIKNPKHRGFFMMEGTTKKLMAPLQKSGNIFNVLTNAEKAYLEKALGMEDNGLSVYKREDNFWQTFYVSLTRDPLVLDLSQPYDYIRYKILLAHNDYVAKSIHNIRDKATYKFYIERQKDVDKIKSLESDLNVKVWTKFAEIAQSKNSIINYFHVYAEMFPKYKKYKSMAEENHNLEFLKAQLVSLIKEDMVAFSELIDDPYFDAKLLISKGIKKGVLRKDGFKYFIGSDSEPFAHSLKEACMYIESPSKQEFKLTLEERVK